MADHTYSGFNGRSLSYKEAQQKVRDIQTTNAKVGARGWTQEIVKSGSGYKVVEHSPSKSKKK